MYHSHDNSVIRAQSTTQQLDIISNSFNMLWYNLLFYVENILAIFINHYKSWFTSQWYNYGFVSSLASVSVYMRTVNVITLWQLNLLVSIRWTIVLPIVHWSTLLWLVYRDLLDVCECSCGLQMALSTSLYWHTCN